MSVFVAINNAQKVYPEVESVVSVIKKTQVAHITLLSPTLQIFLWYLQVMLDIRDIIARAATAFLNLKLKRQAMFRHSTCPSCQKVSLFVCECNNITFTANKIHTHSLLFIAGDWPFLHWTKRQLANFEDARSGRVALYPRNWAQDNCHCLRLSR